MITKTQDNGLIVNDEQAQFARLLAAPQTGVFVANPTRGQPYRSVVMAGTSSRGFAVAIECINGDHRARALRFVQQYRKMKP